MSQQKKLVVDTRQQFAQRKTRRGWELSQGWAWAIRSILALALTGPRLAAEVPAAIAPPNAATTAPPAEASQAQSFHIIAGPLDTALQAWTRQSGVMVTLTIPSDSLTTLQTPGIAGEYTPEDALRGLLQGTGLTFRFNLASAAPSVQVGLHLAEQVDVNGSASEHISLGRFTESVLDTPQTLEVVPDYVLRDQQNRTLMDAVRNVPGISLAAGESGAQGDNLTIRGFTARNDIYLDGIRDFGSYYRDSFNYDQVEVLEGPAGVQFGRGSTGGVINQESKVPQTGRFVHIETQFGTDLTRRITADINEPLTESGSIAFRANAMGMESGVAGRPYAENRRFGLAPSITFGERSSTRATLSYFHLTENDTPDYGLPWFGAGLAPGVNRHSYFGFPDANYLRTNDDILTLRANHAFGSSTDLHTTARAANYPRNVQITEPQICSNVSVSTPVGGWVASLPTSALNTALPCVYTRSTPASQITVNRNQIKIKSTEGDLYDQTEVTSSFRLFGVRNDLAAGLEGGQEISNPTKYSYTENKINSVTPTTLANPNPTDVFSGTGYISSIAHGKSKSAGIYFVDTLKFSHWIELSGGARWDYFNTLYNLYAPPTAVVGAALTAAVPYIDQTVRQPSYRAALVFKPNQHGSVYFDYGTSFNPSAETLSLSVSSSILPPVENETYEAGAKYSLAHDRVHIEGAWFRTEQDNARETDPTNSNNIVLSGNQLVRGAQASAAGQLGGGTDFVVGYAFLASQVLASKFYPTSVGQPLANVPRHTFNAFLTHNLPWRLNAGFGSNYVASRTASSTVPFVPTAYGPATAFALGAAPCSSTATTCYQVLSTAYKQVPGYWTFNAMLKRQVSDHLDLQANFYNLLNRFYIDQPHPSHLIPGAGFTALIGASFRF
jgi:catecholate siderophore receptor